MKITFRIAALLLALLFVLPLAVSAHGSKEKKSFIVPETFDTTKEYTLTFWAKNDSNVVQKKVYNDAIAAFEELYPNVHIEMRSFTDYNLIYNDVITNIATDTTPNICISYPDHVATYITGQNIVVPLDDLINDVKYGLGGTDVRFDSVRKDEVISKFLNEGKIGVNIYT
ncbi:MAG: ABC transporter substrate-binding protein, partial [Firmicutes bacterium]|nr:ABC transporter substrate-binding protein [Candidatus Colimorpha enterica]